MARRGIPEPHFNVLWCLTLIEKGYEHKFMERHSVAEEEQGSDKPGLFFIVDEHGGHGYPEVARASGERARTQVHTDSREGRKDSTRRRISSGRAPIRSSPAAATLSGIPSSR
jgi:hypothetical protein